jgi:hypothetical protein
VLGHHGLGVMSAANYSVSPQLWERRSRGSREPFGPMNLPFVSERHRQRPMRARTMVSRSMHWLKVQLFAGPLRRPLYPA